MLRMTGRPWSDQRTSMMLALIVWVAPVNVLADIIGVVTASEGESRLIRGAGYFAVERGIDIDEGDVIRTSRGAHVQLDMNDGSIFEIGESSEFYLSEYRLRDSGAVENAAVSLIKGWLRFFTAKVPTSHRYEINMSVATIGIRGTEGVLASNGDSSRVFLETGRVEVFELDDEGKLGVSKLMVGGEFLHRERGKPIKKLRSAPAQFRGAMPEPFKKPAKRLVDELKHRGIVPKKLREVRYQDVDELFKANPRVRRFSTERFKSKLEDSRTKEGAKRHINEHPERKKLRQDGKWRAKPGGRSEMTTPNGNKGKTIQRKRTHKNGRVKR